jgi:cytoskeletal protein CcmA (bactofilin family)
MIFRRNARGLLERQGVATSARPYEAPDKKSLAINVLSSDVSISSSSSHSLPQEAPLMSSSTPTQSVTESKAPWESEDTLDYCKIDDEEMIEDLSAEQPETVLGEGVCFKGELSFKRYLCINGEFEGELTSKGKLKVGKTGVVRSNLRLCSAIIEGRIEGDIVVEDLLELRGTAQVYGNISARYLRVDDGVTLCGHIKINPQGLDINEPILFGEEVKR